MSRYINLKQIILPLFYAFIFSSFNLNLYIFINYNISCNVHYSKCNQYDVQRLDEKNKSSKIDIKKSDCRRRREKDKQ